LLLDERQLAASRSIRRHLTTMNPAQGMKTLIEVLGKQKTNQALFNTMRV
jgi:transcription termination factor Rho